MHHLRIAIDGPAGAGKSTVAREVAKRLGLLYVDTGAMYRAVAWLVDHHGIPVDDVSSIVDMITTNPPLFQSDEANNLQVFAETGNITSQLRSPKITKIVSPLSAYPEVREILTRWQREFCKSHQVVMDGRDIGTVVLPDADVKIFLTADIHERAARRAAEMRLSGFNVSLTDIESALAARDMRDSSREIAPLKAAVDAIEIDSTNRSIDDVVEEILTIVEQVAYD